MKKLLIILGLTFVSIFMCVRFRMELGLDLAGGLDLLYAVRPADPERATRARDVIADRVDALGIAGATVQLAGENRDRIRVQVPGREEMHARVKETISVSSMLAFQEVDTGRTVLVGEDIARADVATGELGAPEIHFELTPAGAEKAADATKRLVGRRLAIVVGGKTVMAPVVEGPFEANGRIVGGMKIEEAVRAVRMLAAGSLPVELEPLAETSVGASLGEDTVRQGLRACAAGAALVAAFMLVLYRGAGALAVAALALNLVMQLALLSALGATLTLPGIAGFALTAGMAVDSNVLVFERIRDELRAGKTRAAALAAGYRKAFAALVDSHATSLLTGAALYAFGSGPVRGFAVTLVVGLLVNMFTATWVTRSLQEVTPGCAL